MKLELQNLHTFVQGTDREIALLRGYLQYKQFVYRGPGMGDVKDVSLFNSVYNSFPSGLIHAVRKLAREENLPIEIKDARVRPCDPDWGRLADLLWLREDQIAMVQALAKRTRGIIKSATGSGKGSVAVAVGHLFPCRWLFIVHRAQIARDVKARYEDLTGEPAGYVGEGGATIERFTCATYQALYASRQRRACIDFLLGIDGVLLDECFPAGTMVGDCPIESLKVGDRVPSFDPNTQTLVTKPVVRLFKHTPSLMVKVRYANFDLCCTANHPFYTERGWVPAHHLTRGDRILHATDAINVRRVRRSARKTLSTPQRLHFLLRTMQIESEREAPEKDNGAALFGLCQRSRFDGSERFGESAHGAVLLLRRMQRQTGIRAPIRKHENHVDAGFTPKMLRVNDPKQSYGQSRSAPQTIGNVTRNGMETTSTRRERPRANRATKAFGQHFELADGIRFNDKSQAEKRLSPPLQNRHSVRGPQDRTRGGRKLTQDFARPKARQEERRIFTWVGVDGVEVLQPGSDGTFGGVCPDGFVYNIEVQDTHTYLANGIVVHNCHSVGAESYQFISMSTPNAYWRCGLSGTPMDRTDNRNNLVVASLGQIIYEANTQELIAKGIIARTNIQVARLFQPDKFDALEPNGKVYNRLVVNSKERNKLVCQLIDHARANNRFPALVFVQFIKHARNLAKLIQKRGIKFKIITAKHVADVSQREDLVRALGDGDLDLIIANVVLQEGIDERRIRCVISASGGKSAIRTLQQAGRAMRVAEDKSECWVYEIKDLGHRWMERHANARLRAFEREGHEINFIENELTEV